ncbi:LexA family transcriptional regulator [Companilactobacillus zhachilii]|uniref:XRE family transcriptional regulator n=1 Tax=Companilactobacillus zhachilii TaxID=2304606 RepID=UPI00192095BA|nr:XRE family transcriptional regulator [Companilactobacillus zhachilii]MBL3532070.1 LexA family transcriptional regulator [Companilactobacillus zhachilii]
MFGTQLKNLRFSRKMSQDTLAKKLNKKYKKKISKSMISRWENNKTDPQMEYVRIIADYFDISSSNLLNNKKNNQTDNIVQFDNSSSYNYFDTGISAGSLLEVDPFMKDDVQQITLSNIMMGKYAGDKDIIISHVNGESMNRVLPDRSLIAIKKFQTISDLCNGDIVVFQDGGDMSVKRFYNDSNSKIVTFSPDSYDASFHTINYRYEDFGDVRVIGKVVVYTVEI